MGGVGNGDPSVGDIRFVILIVGTLLLHVIHAEFFVFSACCTTRIYDLFVLPTAPKYWFVVLKYQLRTNTPTERK